MSADATDSRRKGRSRGPGPFDPGSEFTYDPERAHEHGDSDGLAPSEVGPGPFDPGPEVRYDPNRGRDPEAGVELDEVTPPPEIEISEPEIDPTPAVEPEPEPPREPEPQPPTIPEPEPPAEPEPQPPPPQPPSPPPAPEQPVDTLDPAPWVPSAPPRRRPPRRRPAAPPSTPHRRSRGRALLAVLAVGLLAGGVAWASGVDLPSPLDSSGSGTINASAAGTGAPVTGAGAKEEEPSSMAITADSGPYHPVAFEGKVDYGEAGAKFGASRYGHTHEGQDMFAKPGTPLVAVRDGVVVDKGNDGGRGNYIGIYSPEAKQTYVYLHMIKPTWLKPGDDVAAGTQVGGMGCTGSCYGVHLHFEIREGDDIEAKPIDPLPQLKKWPQAPPLEGPQK